jgi:hypothetical protein
MLYQRHFHFGSFVCQPGASSVNRVPSSSGPRLNTPYSLRYGFVARRPYPDRMPGMARTGHSRMGVFSFVLSVLSGGIILCLLALFWFYERWEAASGQVIDAPGAGLLARYLMLTSVFLSLIAVGLGIAGMLQRRRRRLYAVSGTAISVVVLVVAWYGWLWPMLEFFIYCNNNLPPIPRCLD